MAPAFAPLPTLTPRRDRYLSFCARVLSMDACASLA